MMKKSDFGEKWILWKTKKLKWHFGQYDSSVDDFRNILCGKEWIFKVTNNKEKVTCKNCLKKL